MKGAIVIVLGAGIKRQAQKIALNRENYSGEGVDRGRIA